MFESCFTQSEARAEYHRLAKQMHPDIGGNNADMAALNTAYSELKPRNRHESSERSSQKKASPTSKRDYSEDYIERHTRSSDEQMSGIDAMFAAKHGGAYADAVEMQARGYAIGHFGG